MTEPARQRFAAHLRTLRSTRGRTQAQIGHHLRVSPDAVRKWESGRSLPDEPGTARALDAYLDADGQLFRAYVADAADRTGNRTATGQPLSAATVLADSAQQAAEFGTWAETSNVGEVAIISLHNRVRELATRALTEAPEAVARDTASLNTDIFALLRGHHRPAHARALYSTAGASCALLTWLAGDLGKHDLAQVHAATAAMCAEMSEDAETVAWVYVARSKTALWAHDYREAARLARTGAMLGAPGTAAVMLACQEADAAAKLGEFERTEHALSAAARAAEHVREPDRFGGLFSCGPGRAANYASGSQQMIGNPVRALVEADLALDAFAVGSGYGFGTVAQVHITKTLAHTDAGDLDAAAEAVRPVLALAAGCRLATLTGRLAPLARALDAPALRSSTVATPLREEIREFCKTTGQRALTSGDESGNP